MNMRRYFLVLVLCALSLGLIWAMGASIANGPGSIWVAAAVGLCVGSFLNVIRYRWPKAESLVFQRYAREELGLNSEVERYFEQGNPLKAVACGRSRCCTCAKPLSAHELVPVVSWLVQKGRCSSCWAPVSSQYAVVELVTAVGSAALVWSLGVTVECFLAVGAFWSAMAAGLIDLDELYLPDFFTQSLVLFISCFLLFSTNGATLGGSICAALIGYYGAGRIFPYLFGLLLKKEPIGQGDAILLGALGAVYGVKHFPVALLATCALGFATFLCVNFLGRIKGEISSKAPFGPAIMAVTIVGLALKL